MFMSSIAAPDATAQMRGDYGDDVVARGMAVYGLPYKHSYAVVLANRESAMSAISNVEDLVNPNLRKLHLNVTWQCQLDEWTHLMEYLSAICDFEAKTGRELDAIIAPIAATASRPIHALRLCHSNQCARPYKRRRPGDICRCQDEGCTPLTDWKATVQAECESRGRLEMKQVQPLYSFISRRLFEERIKAIAEKIGRLVQS
ncbi:hypothetical protein ED733_006399 [Metarhizium rileyi]|uniref:Uncharacterized protein n=1 Tax=Metarhizium rileyi (strain RCEF 4871) TaxID=1649241 RepID=A0A5C6GN93_METRR|nr:hypothetical protein ED733_006399 [Metarhizium rileyi]